MSEAADRGLEAKFSQNPGLLDVVNLLVNLYELMCPALLEHSRELAKNCEALARALGWDRDEAHWAFLGGLFHDVGHLMSPGEILNWRGDSPPPREEMEIMHPEYGERLLKHVKCLEPILPVIRHHHEHYDGTGFPDRLGGNDIPELARLVALVHHYQTLLRGYGTTAPLPYKEAIQVLEEDAGVIVDPQFAKVFIAKVAC